MDNIEIKRILEIHRVNALFHANTVLTSISFLKNKGLCSRAYIDKLPDSYQTHQYSDKDDKAFGIYNDIFFDSVDIHDRAKRNNKYGPVMFVYDLDLLLLPELENKVWITKDNPIRWNQSMIPEDKYFMNLDELQNRFHKGCFQQHITLHDTEKIGFQYLREIQIDPLPEKYQVIFSKAYVALTEAVKSIDLEIDVTIRQCSLNCQCQESYKEMYLENIRKMYKTGSEQ
ncbi:hypothetical protein [Megasphaera sp.]|uniref:hypothetical protein n=1 Tax=Megasphaera sp. TaxID=2023260 RepID=UPI003F81DF45